MAYNYYYLFEFFFLSISLCFFISIPVRIALRYREHKRRELIFVGIAGLIMTEISWFFPINSLLQFLNGTLLPLEAQALLAGVGIPIGVFFWGFAMTDLMYKKQQKNVLIFGGLFCIIYELIFIPSVFIILPSLREFPIIFSEGFMQKFFQVNPPMFILFILTFGINLLVILISGLRFGYENLIADDPINNFQGKCLMLAFLLNGSAFAIMFLGVHVYFALPIYYMCAILMYFTFAMPQWMKDRLLREK